MLDTSGFIVHRRNRIIDKAAANFGRTLRPVEFMSQEELNTIPAGSVFIFDVETYVNFFYVAFKCLLNGKFVAFEQSPDKTFNSSQLLNMLWKYCIVGFNSTDYDIPMLVLAAKGASNEKLKEASNFIIQSGLNCGTKKVTPFDFEREYKVKIGKYNHIDLFNVCPVNGGLTANPASLKLYAARLHCERMQDLPFPEDHILTQSEAEIVRPYCCNDLANTELLFNELAQEIKLRQEMGLEYDVDLRSKSDAQVAEAVINKELEKVLGRYPQKPTLKDYGALKFNVPDFITFQTPQLNAVLEKIKNAEFHLDALGSPVWPHGLGELEKVKGGDPKWVLKTKIGKSTYKLGMGGLHSNEKKIAHYATDDIILSDNDVESFYPRIILNQRLFPAHLGEAFLTVFEYIVNKRIDAKAKAKALKATDRIAAAGYKVIADSLKITINGSFGKLGNKYSTLYAPQLMLQVTITGQLVLLMLIEALEQIGIEVISGNTDGIICKYHKSRHDEVRAMIAGWEKHTNFKTEETRYAMVCSRDVNSYVAVKYKQDPETKEWTKEIDTDPKARFLDEQLGAKTKGAYCERGSALNSILSKNPEALVCGDAVLKYLINGTSIEKTIKECTDFKRFVCVKNVKGGGEKNGKYLGKVVRWYYPKNEGGYIAYVGSGNKVAKTDEARPVMDLPSEFPEDVNYDWYIKETIEMLHNCGKLKKAETAQLFF